MLKRIFSKDVYKDNPIIDSIKNNTFNDFLATHFIADPVHSILVPLGLIARSSKYVYRAIKYAIETGNSDALQQLLQISYINVNRKVNNESLIAFAMRQKGKILSIKKGSAEANQAFLTIVEIIYILDEHRSNKPLSSEMSCFDAARTGNTTIILSWLASVTNQEQLNAHDESGNTVLHLALAYNQLEVIRLLLPLSNWDMDYVPNTNFQYNVRSMYHYFYSKDLAEIPNHYNLSFLYRSSRHGDINSASFLMQVSTGWGAITRGIVKGCLARNTLSVRKNLADAFLDAALNGFSSIVTGSLINHVENSKDINVQNANGDTAFILACGKGNLGIVKVFLDYKPAPEIALPHPTLDVTHKNEQGFTALSLAALHGQEEVVRTLIADARVPAQMIEETLNILEPFCLRTNDEFHQHASNSKIILTSSEIKQLKAEQAQQLQQSTSSTNTLEAHPIITTLQSMFSFLSAISANAASTATNVHVEEPSAPTTSTSNCSTNYSTTTSTSSTGQVITQMTAPPLPPAEDNKYEARIEALEKIVADNGLNHKVRSALREVECDISGEIITDGIEVNGIAYQWPELIRYFLHRIPQPSDTDSIVPPNRGLPIFWKDIKGEKNPRPSLTLSKIIERLVSDEEAEVARLLKIKRGKQEDVTVDSSASQSNGTNNFFHHQQSQQPAAGDNATREAQTNWLQDLERFLQTHR